MTFHFKTVLTYKLPIINTLFVRAAEEKKGLAECLFINARTKQQSIL